MDQTGIVNCAWTPNTCKLTLFSHVLSLWWKTFVVIHLAHASLF